MNNEGEYRLLSRNSVLVYNPQNLSRLKSFQRSRYNLRRRKTCIIQQNIVEQVENPKDSYRHLLSDTNFKNADLLDKGYTLSQQGISILNPDFFTTTNKNLYETMQTKVLNDKDPGEGEEEDSIDYIDIREKTPYEFIDELQDSLPFLEFRRAVFRIKAAISEFCLRIINYFVFEYFIILVILANICVMALSDSNNPNNTLDTIDYAFLLVYTVEAGLKIIGLGLIFKQGSYLRDHWNKMDFIIVITGWLSIVSLNSVSFSSLRTLRVLRPLRSITSISGLRVLFVALIRSLVPLLASLCVLFVFLLIFGIAGVQLWMGEFRNQCMNLETGVFIGSLCGDYSCEKGSVCVYSLDNPNFGVTNFDNIAFALLNVFQCITLEGWTNIMISSQKTFSTLAVLYYVPLVFIGAFLLLNMTLAVMKHAFAQAMKENRAEKKKSFKDKTLKKEVKFVKPELQDIYIEKSPERKPEIYEIPYDTEKIPLSNTAMNTQRASIKGMINDENPALYEAEGESEDRMALISMQKKNLYQVSAIEDSAEVPSGRSGIDPMKEVLIMPTVENEDNIINKKKNNSLARTLSYRLSRPWKRNITECYQASPTENSKNRHRSSVEQGAIVNKFNFSKEIEALKFFVIEFDYENSSTADIIPEEIQDTEILPNEFMKFTYSQQQQDQIETDLGETREEFYNRYPITKTHFRVFLNLSLKTNNRRAFAELNSTCKNLIEKVQKRDLMSQKTIGIWSGFDVSKQNHEKSVENLSKMSYEISKLAFFKNLQKIIQRLIEKKFYHRSMITFVILNTIVLSLDHYGISSDFSLYLSNINTSFTYIFLAEMILKLLAKGMNYFRDYMNYFDAIVVILSMIELVYINRTKSTLSAFRAVRIFRVFRVIRVARLFRYLQSMALIMKVITASLSKFIYLALLLLLFTVVYSLLGMQVFGGNFNFKDGLPRSNYDTFHNSFISTFQVLSIENWQGILFNAMRSDAGIGGAFMLISWIILGNYVLLNLFLAILLEGFSMRDDVDLTDVIKAEEGTHPRRNTIKRSLFGDLEGKIKKKREAKMKMMEDLGSESEDSQSQHADGKEGSIKKVLFEGIECEKSYFIFSKQSSMRIWCYEITNKSYFETGILIIISLSTLKLVIETYYLRSPTTSLANVIMNFADIAFTVLFAVEFILKSIGCGFVSEKGSYLRDVWNCLDFGIIIFSTIDLSLSSINLSALKAVRVLRTLRPLRFISHNFSMKIVVVALIESLAAIFNVIIVLIIVWLMFAILGVSLLGGKLYYCENSYLTYRPDCISAGYEWKSYSPNYDNVINAISTLFILSSEEGWPDIMYQAVDARDTENSPSRDSNPYIAYYFVIFVFVGSFFFLNFFVGVVFDKFNWAKKNEISSTSLLLSKDQLLWVEIQKLLTRAKFTFETKTHQSNMKKLCYGIYKNKFFEIFIILTIFLNLIQMSIVYNEAPNKYISILESINMAVTMTFILESLIKIAGNGIRGYFDNNWNKFDFFVIVCSIIDITMSYFVSESTALLRLGPQMLRVFRLLRVSKLIRIFRALNVLDTLVTIIGYSLPAILNVLSLMLLVFFIYAILGVNLYYRVESGKIISQYTNFTNFGMAMITLFRISTGEDWYLILYDCSKNNNYTVAGLYFMSFVMITSFVMLNFFIMVILQTYDDYESNPFNILKIFAHDIKKIRAIWIKHSAKYGYSRTHFSELMMLMRELPNEYGEFSTLDYDKLMKKMSAMQFEIDSLGFIYYNDFLFSVLKVKYSKRILGNKEAISKRIMRNEEIETQRKLQRIREGQRAKLHSAEQLEELASKKKMNFFLEILNVKAIFKTWKNWAHRRRYNSGVEYSLSVTPLDSIIEYPGENSESSKYISIEDNDNMNI
ncbi:hypothetical protein SteCoe_28696 [Stentor coeruleus]|uniref:Ion transport domain-containing protein n=1 Tax=Stentor coeruleus TaxID=5963 RepID=A0A1R2B7M5_9CILI|nr:hypothetical protein SteCoe_28696 [Stentor coeruleus]